ncbi:RICIN domain-containing protein [Streptomyces mayteni]
MGRSRDHDRRHDHAATALEPPGSAVGLPVHHRLRPRPGRRAPRSRPRAAGVGLRAGDRRGGDRRHVAVAGRRPAAVGRRPIAVGRRPGRDGRGNCLDTAGGSTQTGANVEMAGCDDSASQVWNVERQPGLNAFSLVSTHSDLCADVAGGTREAGATIRQWICGGAERQVFSVERA